METQKEQVISILNDWGFKVIDADEEHIIFRYQLKSVVCVFDKNDETFYGICMTEFMNYDEKIEPQIHKLCNIINRNQKQVKAYTLDDHRVVASAEFYCYDNKDLDKLIKSALDGIIAAKIYLDKATA